MKTSRFLPFASFATFCRKLPVSSFCSVVSVFLPLVVLFVASTKAEACSIPVFRYALDRWPADPYRLEVAAADSKDETVARFLRNLSASTPMNLEVVRLPASAGDATSKLLPPHAQENLAPPVWIGSLGDAAIGSITNSPARREIVRRILEGESAVWILVESGDRAADDAAAAKLSKRIQFLESVMQLAPIDPGDPSSQLGPGPALKIKFSLLRVSALDAGEKTFLAMLAGPKSGLHNGSQPWYAAVFGRGRTLGAWAAEGFGDEQIEEVSQFLTGACSCQVKKLNPGWDLLLFVDWDESLRAIGFPQTQAAAAQTSKGNSAASPETVTITGAAPQPVAAVQEATPPPDRSSKLMVILATAGVLLVGAIAWRRS
ncbi:MAG TPA: hypothetical protein VK968_13660 [Roseimicrobium sp.]|nr:hypothetical protein [Roseimicrobium sp.]